MSLTGHFLTCWPLNRGPSFHSIPATRCSCRIQPPHSTATPSWAGSAWRCRPSAVSTGDLRIYQETKLASVTFHGRRRSWCIGRSLWLIPASFPRSTFPPQKQDNTTQFEVKLLLPGSRTFVQGSQVNITTTVRRLVNTTQGATYITLRPRSDLRLTWAAGFAHTEAQRAKLSGETEQAMFDHSSRFDRYSTMMMAQPVKSSAEEQQDFERDDDFMFGHFRSRRSGSRDKQHGAVLDPALDIQTVAVNFTM